MPTFDHDIIIVGSGPAGSSTALHLARRVPWMIPRILVLERARHPREKLCAGGLVPDAIHYLDRLGLDLSEIPSVKASWMHLFFQGRGGRLRLFDDYSFPIVRRHELDGWLAGKVRAAGIAVQEDTQAKSARAIPGGVEIVTDRGTLRAQAVVGADGSNSVVRKAVQPATGAGVGRSIEVLTGPSSPGFPGSTCAADDAFLEFGNITRGCPGFTWSFPALEKGAPRRTFGTYDSRVGGGPPNGSLKDVLDRDMAAYGYQLSDYPTAGHPVRWFQPNVPISAPHVLLAGDAAGVDPFFGEGISLALGYGDLAAAALELGFARRDLSFARYTDDVAESPMGHSLLARWLVAQAVYRVRSPAVHAALWRYGEKAITALCQHVIFNWARPPR
jgi:flavin-dependent dehydrogenase